MEIKNGVGITEDRVFIRMPRKDNGVERAVRVILQSSGVAYTTWEVPNNYDSEITKYLNLVEPKQLPNEAGSVIRNVRTERHIYNEAVLAANGEWRVASKDSRERKLGAIFSQAIIEWEEV